MSGVVRHNKKTWYNIYNYLKYLHYYLTPHIFKLRRKMLISSYPVFMGHRKYPIQVTDRLYYTLVKKIPVKRFSLINVQLINCLHNVDHVKYIFLDLMHHCTRHCIILMPTFFLFSHLFITWLPLWGKVTNFFSKVFLVLLLNTQRILTTCQISCLKH